MERHAFAVKKLVENGAWAGFISAWSVSSVLLVVELTSGVQSGIFYSVIGVALGVTGDPVDSALAGFLLHILTGTLVGAAGGFSIAVCPVLTIYRIAKSLAVGVSIGMVAWAVLFLPITALVVLPVLDRVLVPSTDNSELYAIASQASGMLTVIIAGSAVFHALYGLVYGTMMTLLIPYKSRDLKNITR
jgi:hypothetical protein